MQNNKLYLKKFVNISIKILILALLGFAFFNIFFLNYNILHSYKRIKLVVYAIIYIICMLAVYKLKSKIQIKEKTKKILKVVAVSIVLLLQLMFGVLISRNIGWDCGVVFEAAEDISNGSFTSQWYFSRYSNNIFLLMILEILFRIAKIFSYNNYLIVAIIFNILMVDFAIIYISKVCRKIIEEKYSCINTFITLSLLFFSPYIGVVYSDTLSLLFPIAIYYYYLCYKENSNKKNIILMALCTIVGFLVKPTNIIVLIAIVIMEIVEFINSLLNSNEKKKLIKNLMSKLLKFMFIYIIVVALVYGIFLVYKNVRLGKYISKQEYEENSFPFTHFLMMGMKPVDYEGKYYGQYNDDDVNATASQVGIEAKKEYNLNQVKLRLSNMGVKGYLSYLVGKYAHIISDGTFFYGCEGSFYTSEPYYSNSVAKVIQKFVYIDKEYYYDITKYIMQAIWGVILLTIVIGSILKFNKENLNINIMELSIIGIIMFILLFESRSRYLMNYLPIFIVLSTYSISNIIYKIKGWKLKEKKVEKLYTKINDIENVVKSKILDKKNLKRIFLVAIILLAIIVRVLMMKYVSGDYGDFLSKWFDEIKEQGGIRALKNNIGDYNVPYLTILAILTYLPISSLISIKVVSIIFDFVCAIFAGLLVYEILGKNENSKFIACLTFAIILFLPTVLMNSSLWAQCDTIYVSFILISLYLIKKDKVFLSFLFLGIAFAFKLQFIFIVPVYILLYLQKKNISFLHFFIIPTVNVIMCLPALIQGRSLIDCLSIYFKQTGSYEQITLNYTNIYNIFGRFFENQSGVGVIFTIFVLGIISMYIIYKNIDVKSNIIPISLLYSILIVFFLPKMHDRYAFLAEILAVIYVMLYKKSYYFPIVLITCAVYGYYCFLAPTIINWDYMAVFSVVEYIAIAKFTWDTLRDIQKNQDIKSIE